MESQMTPYTIFRKIIKSRVTSEQQFLHLGTFYIREI